MSNQLFSSCIVLLRKAADAPQQLSALRSSLGNAADDVVHEHMIRGIAALENVVTCQNRIPAAIAVLEAGQPGEAMNDVPHLLWTLSSMYVEGLPFSVREEQLLGFLFGAPRGSVASDFQEAADALYCALHPEEFGS